MVYNRRTTTMMKYNFDENKYAEMVEQCNSEPNKYIIVDTGETYEVQEIQYDLAEEKEKALQMLYTKYKRELANTIDPTELQASMMLAQADEKIDVIAPNGGPRQYTSDGLTELLNTEMAKRNELLLRYKTAYNKIKNAKEVETVHATGL